FERHQAERFVRARHEHERRAREERIEIVTFEPSRDETRGREARCEARDRGRPGRVAVASGNHNAHAATIEETCRDLREQVNPLAGCETTCKDDRSRPPIACGGRRERRGHTVADDRRTARHVRDERYAEVALRSTEKDDMTAVAKETLLHARPASTATIARLLQVRPSMNRADKRDSKAIAHLESEIGESQRMHVYPVEAARIDGEPSAREIADVEARGRPGVPPT